MGEPRSGGRQTCAPWPLFARRSYVVIRPVRTLRAMSADDEKQKAPPPRSAAEEERALRDAEARALAESGLGSGLLPRQSVPLDAESVAALKVCPQCGREDETAARLCPLDGTAL